MSKKKYKVNNAGIDELLNEHLLIVDALTETMRKSIYEDRGKDYLVETMTLYEGSKEYFTFIFDLFEKRLDIQEKLKVEVPVGKFSIFFDEMKKLIPGSFREYVSNNTTPGFVYSTLNKDDFNGALKKYDTEIKNFVKMFFGRFVPQK